MAMRSKRNSISIVLVLLLAACAMTVQAQSAYDYILRGEQYLAQAAADSAIAEFSKAVALEANNSRAHFGLGRAYELRSRALRVFNYRMELLTESGGSREAGFPPLTDQGYSDVASAITAYEKAANGWPRYSEAFYRGAVLHYTNGLTNEAKNWARLGVNEDRLAIGPAVLLASILADEGNFRDASAALDQIRTVSSDSTNPTLLGAYALVEFKQGRIDQAIQLLNQAVSRTDAPAYVYKYLGDAYAARGQHQQAIESYQQAAYRDQESILSRNAFGNALRLNGEAASAVQHLAFAASSNPNLLEAVLGHASSLIATGGASQALGILTPVVDRLPVYSHDNARLLRAIAMWRSGNAQGALAAVNDVLGLNPANRIAEIYKTRIEREAGSGGVSPYGTQPRSVLAESAKDDKPFQGVMINNGAKLTNNRRVTLAVYGELTQVAFSNDGSSWSTWFSKPEPYGEFSWDLSQGDGRKTVYMKFRGFLGIGIPGESGNIVLDTTPASASATLTPISGNRYAVDLNASDSSGIEGFWMSTDGQEWQWFNWKGSRFGIAIPSSYSGSGYALFSVVDSAGNHTQVEASVRPADTVPPRITNVQAVPGTGNTAQITWATDEPSDSYVEYWIPGQMANRAGTSDLTTNHVVAIGGLVSGSVYYYRVVSTDAAGNRGQSADMYFAMAASDTTPPTISRVQATATGWDSANITWATDEASDQWVEYWASGIGMNRQGSAAMSTSHSVAITGLRSGVTYFYHVVSTDAAGNRAQSPDMTFWLQPVDTTPPVLSRIEASAVGSDRVAVTWLTDEPSDQWVEYWASGISMNRQGSATMSTSHSVTITGLRTGVTYYYRAVSSDSAGNRAQSPDMSFRLQPADNTPPTVSIRINGGAQFTNNSTVQLEVFAQDDSTGALQMSVRDDLSGFGAWQPYAAYTTWRMSSGEGRRTITVKVRDASGNEGQASAAITLDSRPPSISLVRVTDIGSDTAIVTWRTDESSDSWALYGTFTPNATAGQSDRVTVHTVVIRGLNPNTTYYYKVRSQDEAGNVGESSTTTFRTAQLADRNPPTGSITINNGAAYTRYNQVQLNMTARDDSPGSIQMRLREGNGSWSGWMPLESTYTYRISPGDGLKTVSVEFIDVYGNQSRTYSASITLDTRPPRITNVKAAAVSINGATITWNTDEPATSRVEFGTSGSKMNLSQGESTFTSATASSPSGDVGAKSVIVTPVVPGSSLRTSHSVILSGLSANTTYYFQAVSADAAGNVAVLSGFSFKTSGAVVPPPPPPVTPPVGTVSVNWAASANGGRASASSYAPAQEGSPARPVSNAVDGSTKTFWEAARTNSQEWIVVEFAGAKLVDVIRASSEMGYYPAAIVVEAEVNGRWVELGSFKSVAEQRKYQTRSGDLMITEFKFQAVTATKIRLSVTRVSNPSNALRFTEVEALYTGK